MRQCLIDSTEVPFYYRLAALAIGLLDTLFDLGNRLFLWQNTADRKEAGLHERIDAPTHTDVTCHRMRVNHIEMQPLVKNGLLHLIGQMLPHIFWPVHAIE